MSYERKRWHTHVFTSTYTADVSGVCSAMYELGGMTILHDPSGCNSTYTTHDEPRWYDSKSLMFVSGLDEMTAVMGDDSVLIRDAVRAAADLKPRFITLCGASIPHIISFDFKGVARLIERETGIPVLPVATDGLRSYISGAGLAFREWIRRFGDPEDAGREDAGQKDAGLAERLRQYGVNLLGVTPIDFSRQEIVDAMKQAFTDAGIPVNTCFAMGDSFETLTGVYRGAVNVVVSSAGRIPARFMKGAAGIPFVEGLPLGREMTDRLLAAVRETAADGKDRRIFEETGTGENGAGPQNAGAGPQNAGCRSWYRSVGHRRRRQSPSQYRHSRNWRGDLLPDPGRCPRCGSPLAFHGRGSGRGHSYGKGQRSAARDRRSSLPDRSKEPGNKVFRIPPRGLFRPHLPRQNPGLYRTGLQTGRSVGHKTGILKIVDHIFRRQFV